MFAIIACIDCKRKRMVNLGDKISTCPYCNKRSEHKKMAIYFQDEDQNIVREALNQLTGFSGNIERKHASPDIDKYSSLEYRYEHCHGLEEKMLCLSQGLTDLYGEFTLEDIEKFEPKNAEKMLKAMLYDGCVHETKYGRYTA